MSKGFVSLVGAGPGDPGLLTLHGRRALAEADVVLYDYLVHPALLDLARPEAKLVYVGKKGGARYIPQSELTDKMVAYAREGLRVLRLKGGDPFLFGRGGEEALACASKGIPFEVVPGVSSAWAGPAYAGIPLTHRGYASTATVVTGHEDPSKNESGLSWKALAQTHGTLCFLMSMSRLDHVLDRLVEHGMDPATPAAAVQWGTHPRQRTVTGTVNDLAERCRDAGLGAPAVVVVGRVVELRRRLAWFETRPLFGRRILLTRPRDQVKELSESLALLGAQPLSVPSIRIVPPANPSPFRDALIRLEDFDFVLFTSRNAVRFFFGFLGELGFDARSLGGVRVAAIGPATARSLEEHGVTPDFMPDTFTSSDLLTQISERFALKGLSFLLPRANIAPPALVEGLRLHGALVEEVEAYRTVEETLTEEGRETLAQGADGAVFLSSSSVERFLDGPAAAEGAEILKAAAIFSIGPVTSATLVERGFHPLEAREHTVPGVLETMVEHFGKKT